MTVVVPHLGIWNKADGSDAARQLPQGCGQLGAGVPHPYGWHTVLDIVELERCGACRKCKDGAPVCKCCSSDGMVALPKVSTGWVSHVAAVVWHKGEIIVTSPSPLTSP